MHESCQWLPAVALLHYHNGFVSPVVFVGFLAVWIVFFVVLFIRVFYLPEVGLWQGMRLTAEDIMFDFF